VVLTENPKLKKAEILKNVDFLLNMVGIFFQIFVFSDHFSSAILNSKYFFCNSSFSHENIYCFSIFLEVFERQPNNTEYIITRRLEAQP